MSWRRGRGRPNLPQKMPTDTRNQRLRLFGPQKLNICELPMWYTGRISAAPRTMPCVSRSLKITKITRCSRGGMYCCYFQGTFQDKGRSIVSFTLWCCSIENACDPLWLHPHAGSL
jgi:hypothetical protein